MEDQLTAQFQIGKSGLTPGVVESLNMVLATHRQVRISVLKSSDKRTNLKEFALEVADKINWKCASRVIGFTIILTKLSRKPKK